ncbi:MAG TPA: hypothetical protein VI038_04425 [Methyloceanibacter sp.]
MVSSSYPCVCPISAYLCERAELTPPSRAIFVLSVLLAVLALLVRYAHVAIPIVSAHSFETLLIGFLLLLAGNLFGGF